MYFFLFRLRKLFDTFVYFILEFCFRRLDNNYNGCSLLCISEKKRVFTQSWSRNYKGEVHTTYCQCTTLGVPLLRLSRNHILRPNQWTSTDAPCPSWYSVIMWLVSGSASFLLMLSLSSPFLSWILIFFIDNTFKLSKFPIIYCK